MVVNRLEEGDVAVLAGLTERIKRILDMANQEDWTLYDLAMVGINLATKVHQDFLDKEAPEAAEELEAMLNTIAEGLRILRTRGTEEPPKS